MNGGSAGDATIYLWIVPAGKPAGQGGPARERGPQATVSTILPICVLDSMSACAWAASASGKIL